LDPDSPYYHYSLGSVLLAQGDTQAALVAMEQETDDLFRLLGIAVVRYTLGDTSASDAALQEILDEYAEGAHYQIAQAYAFRGEIDHAFDWLEQAYDNRDGGLATMLTDSWLSSLHDDPRWEPFLDKMGFPR
jgi:tetratricopeptide (TPR) repeat protein